MWLITNGAGYILQDERGVSTVANPELALKFSERSKAENFFANLSKSFKNIGYTIQEATGRERYSDINFDEYLDEDCLNNIKEDIARIQTLFRKVLRMREHAQEELAKADAALLDIEHAAEFYSLNAAQGYRLYRMLHETRMERRKRKDQIAVCNIIIDSGFDGLLDGTTLKRIAGMDTREYKPRILQELFAEERNCGDGH